MSKRVRLTDPDDDDEPNPQRRRRITTSVEIPSTDARYESTPRQTAHALPSHLNHILTRAGPGRPAGSKNLIPRKITDSFIEAIERLGSDGCGKDGATGFFMRACSEQPAAALAFASRLLPRHVQTSVDPQSALGQILEGARARLQIEKAKVINSHSITDGHTIGSRWKDRR